PRRRALLLSFHSLVLRISELFLAHMEKEEQLFALVGERASGADRRALPERLPIRGAPWVHKLEVGAARAWPRPCLSLRGLGTPGACGSLCQEYLHAARRRPAPKRAPHDAPRPRSNSA